MKKFLKAYWKDIVMVNYEVPKAVLIPYLPVGTELDDFEGKYYVSLVGFQFLQSSIFDVPIPVYGSFDEVNLRFYVKRKIGDEIRRGVVFISEIVPNRIVAFLANSLYKEHYSYAKMKSAISVENNQKKISYCWFKHRSEFSINTLFEQKEVSMLPGSHEQFIYEHYYGYTKVNESQTWEYKVNHDTWRTNKAVNYHIVCDFTLWYGNDFTFLNNQQPHSVYNAVGSAVSINWNIDKIKA
jgi:uncharacterized protein YqjF (DUF2071 family)